MCFRASHGVCFSTLSFFDLLNFIFLGQGLRLRIPLASDSNASVQEVALDALTAYLIMLMPARLDGNILLFFDGNFFYFKVYSFMPYVVINIQILGLIYVKIRARNM